MDRRCKIAIIRKRPSDEARGKSGRWTAYFLGPDGKRKSRAAYVDKVESQKLANRLEQEARDVREGRVDPKAGARHKAAQRSIEDHAEDYKSHLLAKGGTRTHARHIKSTLIRLLTDAGARNVNEIAPDRIQAALSRWRAREVKPSSARTCNHAIGAVKAFATWLHESNRIQEVPRGLKKLTLQNEAADRRLIRRALTRDELARLIEAAENGRTVDREVTKPNTNGGRGGTGEVGRRRAAPITGPQRATLYRIAAGTGFRANEIRSLTRESFRLDGDEPCIVLKAKDEKAGRGAEQPIRRDLAEYLRPIVEACELGAKVVIVPARTAEILRIDLAAAGIAYRTAEGVVDFHAFRHGYISGLIEDGVDPKTAQILARHSTVMLTIDRYSHTSKSRKRDAIEGGGK